MYKDINQLYNMEIMLYYIVKKLFNILLIKMSVKDKRILQNEEKRYKCNLKNLKNLKFLFKKLLLLAFAYHNLGIEEEYLEND